MNSKDAAFSHELPQAMQIIVADDELVMVEKNIMALQTALSPAVPSLEISVAVNARDLITRALTLPSGLVVLDSAFSVGPEDWAPHQSDLTTLATRINLPVEAIPEELYQPNGLCLALLLRLLQYRGKIVMISGTPVEPRSIRFKLESTNMRLQKFPEVSQIAEPIFDGVAAKESQRVKGQFWAISANPDGSGWDWQNLPQGTPFSECLNQLIRRSLNLCGP